jgi:hypothetical protein
MKPSTQSSHTTRKRSIVRALGAAFIWLCMIAVVLNMVLPRGSSAAADPVVVLPSADTTLKSNYPDSNFGAVSQFYANAKPALKGLVRFAVSGVGQDSVAQARLRLHVSDESPSAGLSVFSTTSNWDEATVTWNTQPAAGPQIGALAPQTMPLGTWVEVDLGQAVPGDGVYSFVLTTASTDRIGFYDRTRSQAPQLVLTLRSDTGVIVPPPTTAPPAPTAVPPAPTAPPVVPLPTGRFYADNSFWNTPIPANPAIDPNSAAIVAKSLVAYNAGSNFNNTDSWGFPVVFADANSKTYTIGCTRYGCNKTVTFRIPAGAKPTTGSDHRLVVIDGTKELDMWMASYDPTTDTWSAGSRWVTDAYGWGAYCAPGSKCGGGTAAGFAQFGGVVRPEEIAQGHIDHALSLITPYTRASFIACPATHTDGKYDDPAALPEGARVQLDPAFNVDAQPWPAWLKTIARAAQQYGAYLNNTGGNLNFNGEAMLNRGTNAWTSLNVPIRPKLSDYNFPWDKFRVLELKRCA